MLKTHVKTAKKRSSASTQWLQRQLNDPYVAMAKQEGYRARSAFKLIELDDKFHFLKPGKESSIWGRHRAGGRRSPFKGKICAG